MNPGSEVLASGKERLAAWIATGSLILVSACAPLTDDPDSKSVTISTTQDVGPEGKTIEIKDGSVAIPPGALAVGSSVSLQSVSQPAEFTAAGATAASEPVEVLAKGPDGQVVPKISEPMTIQLDIEDGTSLALADKADANLCVFLKSVNAELFVWRRSALDLNADARTVSLSTLNFGVFQVVYCGTDVLEGFQEASPQETGEVPLQLSLTVPTTSPDFGHATLCAGLLQAPKDEDKSGCEGEAACDGDFEIAVLGSTEAAATKDAVQTLDIDYGASSIADGFEQFLGLWMVPEGATCPIGEAISTLNSTSEFEANAFFAFLLDPAKLIAGEVKGTLHDTGPFLTHEIVVALSAPDPASVQPPHPTDRACFKMESGKAMTMISKTITSAGIDGALETSFLMAVGSSTEVPEEQGGQNLKVTFGAGCTSFDLEEQTADPQTGLPYTVRLDGQDFHLDGINYLSPVKMTISEEVKSAASTLGATVGCLDVCLQGGLESGHCSDPLGRMLIDLTVSTYGIYLPYVTNENGEPVYDMAVSLLPEGSTCETKPKSVSPALPNPMPLMNRPLEKDIYL